MLLTNCDSYLDRRSWRRADYPVIEIGDLSEEESINYLVNKWMIKKEKAKKFYELVGGNMRDLKSMACRSLDGKCFEGKIGFIIMHQLN